MWTGPGSTFVTSGPLKDRIIGFFNVVASLMYNGCLSGDIG